VEVIERPTCSEVVRWLSRSMDDDRRFGLRHQPIDVHPIANVLVMMLEAPRRTLQPPEVPERVPLLAEKIATHVVVYPVNTPTLRIEISDRFRSDEPARARDESCLAHPSSASSSAGSSTYRLSRAVA